MKIKMKRAYDKPEKQDGYRVLVDRIWPRGIKKQDAQIDEWLKDAAPSAELRKWFGHQPEKWEEFKKRYFEELSAKKDVLAPLLKKKNTVTLVYAAKEEKYNNAAALKEYLSRKAGAAK